MRVCVLHVSQETYYDMAPMHNIEIIHQRHTHTHTKKKKKKKHEKQYISYRNKNHHKKVYSYIYTHHDDIIHIIQLSFHGLLRFQGQDALWR